MAESIFFSNYTIAAIPGDTLTGSFSAIPIDHTGTISAAIAGSTGINTGGGGTLTLLGHSTYVGNTEISDNTVLLENGASLGNTAIWGNAFVIQGTAVAGTSGAGSSGATLGAFQNLGIDVFSMIDGMAGKFTLNQQTGFHGTAIGLNGFSLGFDLSNTAADELVNSGPGTASVTGTNIINISTASARI